MQKQIQHKKQSNKFVKWLSSWSAYAKNKTINALLFFFAMLIIAGANYTIMFRMFVARFFILDLLIIVFLVSPIFFFKDTMFDRIYLPIILAIITVFYIVNGCFYSYFGVIFPLKDIFWAIQNLGQVAFHPEAINWWVIATSIILYILFALAIILYNALWRFKVSAKEMKMRRHKKVAFAMSLLFGSVAAYELCLQLWCVSKRKQDIRDIDYVNYSQNRHFQDLGMLSYYVQEFRQLVSDKGESVSTIRNYLTNSKYLVDDYTGLLKGKDGGLPANIFVIVVETGDKTIYNETITPNLWKVFNDGIYCSNSYSYNHTNTSDAIDITGNYPQMHYYDWNHTKTPFSLPSILKDKYQSYFTHDITSVNDTYNRIQTLKGLNFDHYLWHNDVIPEVEPWRFGWDNFTRDSIFIDGLLKKIVTFDHSKPFYMHYLTVHMHLQQALTPQNKSMFEQLEADYGPALTQAEQDGKWHNPFNPKSEDGKRYRRFTLKAMDLDAGIGQIYETLYDTTDTYLNNTLLAICADHSWYEADSTRHTFAQSIRKIYDINNIKQFQTIMGFYHKDLNAKYHDEFGGCEFAKPTWPSIIVPTILDLLGEKYNPKIYLNKSIFADEQSGDPYDDNEVFYSFWTTRFMNEYFSSQDHHSITNVYGGDASKRNIFIKRMEEINRRLRIIDSIYMKRLFNFYDYDDFMPPEP